MSPRGGFRPGAGRKRMPNGTQRASLCLRMPPALLEWLRDRAENCGLSLSRYVEALLERERED